MSESELIGADMTSWCAMLALVSNRYIPKLNAFDAGSKSDQSKKSTYSGSIMPFKHAVGRELKARRIVWLSGL